MIATSRTKLAALPWLLLLVGLVSCLRQGDGEDPRAAILTSHGEDVIVPSYEAFASKSEALEVASASFCQGTPDETKFLAARVAWKEARYAWKRTEVFAFGPYAEFPERLGPKIDFWPARVENIEDILLSLDDVSASSLENSGTSVRGLPVIEYLLWFDGEETLARYGESTRYCDYLTAATEDLSNQANLFALAWSRDGGNFLDELVAPSTVEDGMYMDVQEAMSEVVNRMGFTIENIRRDKLGRPLGDETGGDPQPDKVESPYSDHSVEDIRANLEMIELLFTGDEQVLGLKSHPRIEERPDLIASFEAKAADANAKLDAIDADGGTLRAAILDHPERVRAAHDSLGELQTVIQADLINLLSLTRSFNNTNNN